MSARSFDINSTKKQSNIQVKRSAFGLNVLLHNHNVFTIFHSGVILDSCGWKTTTTKVAINRAFAQIPKMKGYAVVQKKGVWYVSKPDNSLVEFTDGMSINF